MRIQDGKCGFTNAWFVSGEVFGVKSWLLAIGTATVGNVGKQFAEMFAIYTGFDILQRSKLKSNQRKISLFSLFS